MAIWSQITIFIAQTTQHPVSAHIPVIRPSYSNIYPQSGPFPIRNGLFERPRLAYFSALQLRLTTAHPFGVFECHDRGYVPRARWAPRAHFACDLVRVFSAEARGDGAQPVGNHQPAGAAYPQLRVGDLWRRRIDA